MPEAPRTETTQSATNAPKPVTAKPLTPADKLVTMIDRYKPQLAAALPRSMTADRFARIVMTEVRKNPKLAECTTQSFLGAVFTAAQIGLEIGAHLGEAFVIPFRNTKKGTVEATLLIGYKGMVKLMWDSEQIASLSEVIVHAKDAIEYRQGDDEKILHGPYAPPVEVLAKAADPKAKLTAEEREALDPGPPIAYYAIIKTKNGGRRRAFMWVSEVNAHRDRYARNADDADSVWRTNPDAMALKTVIRKAAKLAPRAVERPSLQQAIALDELAEAGVSQDLQPPPEIAGLLEEGGNGGAVESPVDAFTRGRVVESQNDAKK